MNKSLKIVTLFCLIAASMAFAPNKANGKLWRKIAIVFVRCEWIFSFPPEVDMMSVSVSKYRQYQLSSIRIDILWGISMKFGFWGFLEDIILSYLMHIFFGFYCNTKSHPFFLLYNIII